MSDCEGLPVDDSASAASSMEVTDRIASLEQRVQMQEDDIQLLKSALADVVRRLNITEEQQAMQNKKGPTKARPLVQTLPLRTTVNNGTVLPKKPSGSLPSPSGSRKETVTPAAKSTIKRTSSAERVSPGGRRESYGDSKGSRNRTGSTSSSSSGKKNSESKPKEPMFSAVTLQMSLTPKLLDSHASKAEPLDLPMEQQEPARSESGQTSSEVHRTPTLALPLPKSPSQTFMAFPRSPSFISPMKSPKEGYVKMFLRGRPVTMYMPKEQVESYNLEAKVELPAKRLKLEWVYPFCAGGLLEISHSIMIWVK